MSKELKNVVIIGASSAGAPLARALEKKLPPSHRIILIDSQAFSFYPIAALRAAVVDGWENKVFAELKGFFAFDSRHVMLSETRVVKLGDGFVETNRPNEGFGTRIDFDIAVIATGSTYGSPMRLTADSLEAGKESLRKIQRDIKAAQRIVCVGGGTVGIELAGEILERYPEKQVTIVQSSDRLLNDQWPVKLSNRLAADLKSVGAKLIFGQKVSAEQLKQKTGSVTLTDGRVLEADLIFATAGVRANSRIVEDVAPSALNASGFVKVDAFLRVDSREGPFATSNYFAIGDVADSPGGPTAISAGNDADCVAKSILALTSGSQALAKVSQPLTVLVVPVGSQKGQALLPMVGVLGSWATRLIKGNTLFVSKFQGLYPSAHSALRLDPTSSGSSMSAAVVLPAVGVTIVALALVQIGLLDKGRLGPFAGLF